MINLITTPRPGDLGLDSALSSATNLNTILKERSTTTLYFNAPFPFLSCLPLFWFGKEVSV
jgi:hypothetical protein